MPRKKKQGTKKIIGGAGGCNNNGICTYTFDNTSLHYITLSILRMIFWSKYTFDNIGY